MFVLLVSHYLSSMSLHQCRFVNVAMSRYLVALLSPLCRTFRTFIKFFTMYYELFAIARIRDPLKTSREASKIASTIGRLILNNRGVIREIVSLGPKPLPKIISKDQERHFQGYHFVMGFDSSSAVQQELLRTLKRDPRILRASITKNDMSKKLSNTNSVQRALSGSN